MDGSNRVYVLYSEYKEKKYSSENSASQFVDLQFESLDLIFSEKDHDGEPAAVRHVCDGGSPFECNNNTYI